MYRTSYFNPSIVKARMEAMESEKDEEKKKAHLLKKSPQNLAVLRTMEQRINKYLTKQK